MDNGIRRLVESEWEARLGVSSADLRTRGVLAVTADLGANAAMSFLFDETCIVVVPPEELATTAKLACGLDAHEAFSERFLYSLVGPDAQIDGPSWHGYVNARAFTGRSDASVTRIHRSDGLLDAFLHECDIADVVESGFSLDAELGEQIAGTSFWALQEHGRITAAGNMSDWRGHNADVGVLTHPNHRGEGLAGRVVATMVESMLPTADVVRYRALTSNLASLAVAQRLGFEPFGQNYRARRPRGNS